MRVLTVCTHDAGWFQALQASCHRHGYQLSVLGWGMEWKGLAWKFRLMHEAIRTDAATDLVAFVDAYDVLFLQDVAVLRARVTELLRDTNPNGVLFGVDPLGTVGLPKHGVFAPCNGRTINSGVYVGQVGSLRTLLASVLAASRTDTDNNEMLLNRVCPPQAVLDHTGLVIYTASCANLVRGQCHTLGLHEPAMTNPATDQVPCILHAPGVLDLDPVCRLLELPIGKHRARYTENVWPHVLGAFVLVLLAGCAVQMGIARVTQPSA
jgi:hypothetical protein